MTRFAGAFLAHFGLEEAGIVLVRRGATGAGSGVVWNAMRRFATSMAGFWVWIGEKGLLHRALERSSDVKGTDWV